MQAFFERGRPRKAMLKENERLIYLRDKEKQRRISINKGIENLKDILKQYGCFYFKSKQEVLFKCVEIIKNMEKQIDILISERIMWKMIYIVENELENQHVDLIKQLDNSGHQ